MKTIVRTWLRGGFELSSSPCVAESGFNSVRDLQASLRDRLRMNDNVNDIDGGVELLPRQHRRIDCMYERMTVILLED